MNSLTKDIATKYAEEVAASGAANGELIKLAAQRFLSDFERDDVELDWGEVDRCVDFIGRLRHYTGVHAGKRVKLQPWQIFIVANIIGWRYRETGRRRFTASYIEVARKNGKTFLAAVLCLYFLIADREAGAEIDLAANSRDQARIALDYCRTLAGQADPSGRALRVYRNEIRYVKRNSVLRCFAANDTKLDGFNASFALIDEYHAAKTSKVRDVIKSSQGMRRNPHICTITTAGFDKRSPCYELRTAGEEVLRGIKADDRFFVAAFAPDPADDWEDRTVWGKGNPNLGVTVGLDYLESQVTQAINVPSERTSCKTKVLNIWADAENEWLSEREVMQAMQPVQFDESKPAYVGVDLAATGDLTAVSFMQERGNGFVWATRYYTPASTLERGVLSYYYRQWADAGNLIVTDGNVTDYDRITSDILKQSEVTPVAIVSYDSWNATQWAINATALGLPLVPYSQSVGNFNRPTKEFERLLLGGRAVIEPNPVTSFCFRNVSLKVDANGNSKPSKADYDNKVDGVIAMLMALGGYLAQPPTMANIFTL